ALEKNVFGMFSEEESERNEILHWYSNLVQMMEMEQIKEQGHLQVTKNIVLDLNTLHVELLKEPAEDQYRNLYYRAAPNLHEFEKN
ncbi:MAG: DUF4924 family protein, partial [Chloroflexia bacterium]|nr:DUF4924 family protein [Chloroflexia bacterium]